MRPYKDYEGFVEINNTLFDKHVAKFTKVDIGDHDCIVEFRNPETSNGAMVITYIKGYLAFQGDYGDGSFTWYNSKNSLEWMANIGFDYFMSKIQSGKCYAGTDLMMDHDGDRCIEDVEAYFRDNEIEAPDDMWKENVYDYNEWIMWVRDNGDEYFGDDYYEWAYNAGRCYNQRAYLWKYALVKVVEYLEKQGVKQ